MRFGVWHVDGDCPMVQIFGDVERRSVRSDEVMKAVVGVSDATRGASRSTCARRSRHAEASALADRIVPLNPHYSVEAWTYQHFAKARTLLPARSQAELAHAELDAWHDNRAAIDEVEQIASASAVGERLAKKYNKDLTAAGWPAQEVHAANASFAAFVGLLEAALKRQGLLP
jgi:hypothetical protein